VGGVELVEACHPLHDEQFNAAIASSMWKSLFLTTEQVRPSAQPPRPCLQPPLLRPSAQPCFPKYLPSSIPPLTSSTPLRNSPRHLAFAPDHQLNTLRGHYGESVAFYFAFLNLSNKMLAVAAPIGLLTFAVRTLARARGSSAWETVAPLYALFMVLWGTTLLQLWQRRKAELQARRAPRSRPSFGQPQDATPTCHVTL